MFYVPVCARNHQLLAFAFVCCYLPSVICQLPTGLTMVDIQGGTFTMGVQTPSGPLTDRGVSTAATPAHTVTLSNFRMSSTEVTNNQYREFLQQALSRGDIKVEGSLVKGSQGPFNNRVYMNVGCVAPPSMNPINRNYITFNAATNTFNLADITKANWPVVCVEWYGAWAFANHYGLSLPTEAQWEYAAGGAFGRNYATRTGALGATQGKYNDNPNAGCQGVTCHPENVGIFPPNDFGLLDMGGNVWEWTLDWYSPTWYSRAAIQDPQSTTSDGQFFEPLECPPSQQTGNLNTPYTHPTRATRGGSFASPGEHLRVAYRGLEYPFRSDVQRGFRVASGGNMVAALPTCYMTQCSTLTLDNCRATGTVVGCTVGNQCYDNNACTQDICTNFQCSNPPIPNCQVIFVPQPPRTTPIPPTPITQPPSPRGAVGLIPTTTNLIPTSDDDDLSSKWWIWLLGALALLALLAVTLAFCLCCRPPVVIPPIPLAAPPPPLPPPPPPPPVMIEPPPAPAPPLVLAEHYYPPPRAVSPPIMPPPLPIPSPRSMPTVLPKWEWSAYDNPVVAAAAPPPPNPHPLPLATALVAGGTAPTFVNNPLVSGVLTNALPLAPQEGPPSPSGSMAALSPRIQSVLARAAAITGGAQSYPTSPTHGYPPPPPPPYGEY
eukprot:TRINITY_DN68719_c0_g1_i1.p1 TRINITY_DN68719_c0_g1~~TRINITY_DN68719_c0_g1_i1.p1  ORF type:complete len:661 (-),score=62.11 TRINITY_DN68719_c0_g1_i1:267-2249(-)